MKNWVKIFDTIEMAKEAVPIQTGRLIKIGDLKICLIHHHHGFSAMTDRCPHMGASLSKGIVNYLGEIICPLHEYRFSSKTGEEDRHRCDAVKTYAVKIELEGVFIGL